MDYKFKTTEELIKAYAFETTRLNKDDREFAQRKIKEVLKRRFNATLSLLDDEQTTENPIGTYKYLLGK